VTELMQPAKLSVYIITFNEADKIAAAIQSVMWADEVLVLDSNSTDDTAKLQLNWAQQLNKFHLLLLESCAMMQ
jgi:glycosyltransferase involved in cell wall biosynthesis